MRNGYDFLAAALPPLRPAAFFCAVVPPCFELERDEELEDPDFLPPRLEAPGELEIFAARSFDIPFSFSFSYCFSFLTLGRLPGMRTPPQLSLRHASPVGAPRKRDNCVVRIRRLGPGDEEVVRRLATGEPQTALLEDERC